jgi:hypothetical protein
MIKNLPSRDVFGEIEPKRGIHCLKWAGALSRKDEKDNKDQKDNASTGHQAPAINIE